MDALGPVDTAARQVECAAGARWRELTLQTLRHGLIPNVLPLNLDMSVGGLLCAGGVGANSYRHGPVVANVTALEVATCTGELVRCGADEQPELFAAMLGGLGHVAVITRATLALRPAATSVRTFHLLYETVEAWLEDCRMLQGRGGADHLEGFCWASAKGLRSGPHGTRPFMHWQYGLQASFEYQGAPPEASHALRGTRPWKVLGHLDLDFAAFTFRYQPRFDGMHASGAWEQAHPWLECFLSPEELPRVLPEALDLLPPSLGDGHRLTWVARSNGPSSLRLPSDLSLCFALLPTGVPTHELPGALRALVGAHRLLIDAGGKRYLSGWLGEMDRSAWERHHGERFEAWEGARRRFDPKALLRSVLLPAHCRSASVS
jgi:cytokinin dehydrogenase